MDPAANGWRRAPHCANGICGRQVVRGEFAPSRASTAYDAAGSFERRVHTTPLGKRPLDEITYFWC
jgi:hypothetical protein